MIGYLSVGGADPCEHALVCEQRFGARGDVWQLQRSLSIRVLDINQSINQSGICNTSVVEIRHERQDTFCRRRGRCGAGMVLLPLLEEATWQLRRDPSRRRLL